MQISNMLSVYANNACLYICHKVFGLARSHSSQVRPARLLAAAARL